MPNNKDTFHIMNAVGSTSLVNNIAKSQLKLFDITSRFSWIRSLINEGLIKKDQVCTYSDETLRTLNHWGIYTLMTLKRDGSPLLTLEKALLLSYEEARVFELLDAHHEIHAKIPIDEVIRKYKGKEERYLKFNDNPDESKPSSIAYSRFHI